MFTTRGQIPKDNSSTFQHIAPVGERSMYILQNVIFEKVPSNNVCINILHHLIALRGIRFFLFVCLGWP